MTDLLNRHLIIDGHRIACGVHGDGPPVVLIHGTPSHSAIWRNVLPRLRGWRVHVFDLLGYGASERPLAADTSVAAQTHLLEHLLDAWALETADIVAHDIGGGIGLRLAVHSPRRVNSLTLIDTVSYDSWPSSTWQRIIAEHAAQPGGPDPDSFRCILTGQLQMTVHDPLRMSGEVLEAYLRPITGPVGQAAFFAHQVAHYDSRYTAELTAQLGHLAMPVQLIWGDDDRWQPLHWGERLAADIGAPLHVIPDAGHFAMEDAPEAVAGHVLDFLQEVHA